MYEVESKYDSESFYEDLRAELVIPLKKDKHIYGVLDLDSSKKGRFTERDEQGLNKIMDVLSRHLLSCFGVRRSSKLQNFNLVFLTEEFVIKNPGQSVEEGGDIESRAE